MPIPFFLALSLAAQTLPAAPAQDLTLPPETARIVLIAEGRGTQNYICTAQAGRYIWTFTAPEAQLFNLATGKPIGHHDAGPTWTSEDGSAVQGTLVARRAADAPQDIPWLLLRAAPGTQSQGVLSPVSLVRRYNTHGGAPPLAGCDAAQVGNTQKVPYTATYAFYTDGPSLTRP